MDEVNQSIAEQRGNTACSGLRGILSTLCICTCQTLSPKPPVCRCFCAPVAAKIGSHANPLHLSAHLTRVSYLSRSSDSPLFSDF